MTWQECLKKGAGELAEAGIQDCNTDAWLLMEYITGMTRMEYLMKMNEMIPDEDRKRFCEVIEERKTRRPLQHITGEQEFMGLLFSVNEHVLIPRQDTEVLVEEALRLLRPDMKVLDLCTGSGCILVSLLKYGKHIRGTGADISEKALETAAVNLRRNQTKAQLVQGDLFENVRERYDMIVSNPPYICSAVIDSLEEEVKDHDPRLALDGREDGLHFYRRIIIEGRQFLKDGGYLLFEIGCDQGESVPRLLKEAGYTDIQVKRDLSGLDRVVVAVYNKSEKRRREDTCLTS